MRATDKHFWTYLKLWVLTIFFLLIGIAAFNYCVDPYGLFNAPRTDGFNQDKPAVRGHARLAKPYQVNHVAPQTIIMGNSRPEMGVDPANTCWPTELKPVYNLGLPGASIYMAMRSAQHAMVKNPIKQILWGLDFVDFLSMHSINENPHDWPPEKLKFEDRLNVNADGSRNTRYWWTILKEQSQSLLSMDALNDSFYTLLNQANPSAPSTRFDGFNTAKDLKYVIALEGQAIIFKQKNIEIAKLFSHREWSLYQDTKHWSQEFESVSRLLQLAKQQNVKVQLFINPYHADYLTALELAGWWPDFDQWKRQLTRLSEESGVELWDFSAINEFSVEQPPPMDDRKTLLKWFWEPAHYRREFGNLMLSNLLQKNCSSNTLNSAGTLLTSKNIDRHLKQLSSAMERYHHNYPSAIKRLQLIQASKK